jgi:hypothetical protein
MHMLSKVRERDKRPVYGEMDRTGEELLVVYFKVLYNVAGSSAQRLAACPGIRDK